MCHRILLALDDSSASERASAYVIDLGLRLPDITFVLFHLIPPMPTARRTSLGATARAEDATSVTASAETSAAVEPIVAPFEQAGISEGRIETVTCPCHPEEDPAVMILDGAREYQCDTIVLGRHAKGRGLLGRNHLCDAILKRATGFTVWIVG